MKKMINFILKYKYIILLIILYLLFFIQMQQVFFYGDDFQVLYPVHNNHNFFSILIFCLEKMKFFWNQWSGRIVGHFIVSFGLSLFGIQFFRLLNPIMIFTMIYLCLKIYNLFKKIDIKKYLFIVSLVIISLNVYISRESLYWAYGGILYIWGFNLTLFIVYIVYKYNLLKKNISTLLFLLLLFVCFIQTFILEQLSFMLISFLLLMLFSTLKDKTKNYQLIILLLISIIGFLISSLAPGNLSRTEPLLEEMELYTNLEIILAKIYQFFNMIFNPKLCGFYFMFFALLVNRKYLLALNKKDKLLNKIPSLILISYFVILLISYLFDINILGFYENSDSMYPMYYVNYLTETEFVFEIIKFVLKILYFTVLLFNILFMCYRTLWKENKFLFLSLIVTLFATIIPFIFIRYIGLRYYIFLIMSIIIISIHYILKLNKQSFDFQTLFLLIFTLPFKHTIGIVTIIIFLSILYPKIQYFINRYIVKITCILILTFFIYNIVSTFYGYNQNKKIYQKNDLILTKAKEEEAIILDEVPYRNNLYTWHTIANDFSGKHKYYSFYLNDFYEEYYGVNSKYIYIFTEDGYYVQ